VNTPVDPDSDTDSTPAEYAEYAAMLAFDRELAAAEGRDDAACAAENLR